MGTYSNILVHVIFSTKDRRPFLSDAIRRDVHAYLGGIVRELGACALAVNGTEDHVHMLLSLPPKLAVSDCMDRLKSSSSKWIHERWRDRFTFSWQEGYSAFSVSESARPRVLAYINGQEEHHNKVSFQSELLTWLRANQVPYDERYIWN